MRTYSYNVNGAQYDVTIESIQGQVAKMNVNGVIFDVEILGAPLSEGDLPAAPATVAPAATTPAPAPQPALSNEVSYTYQAGDTFGAVILKLGLQTDNGLWGDNGDVAFYTNQLHEQGIYGNIPVGATIKLRRRQ